MTKPVFDVVGVGNAIVDVISQMSDEFLTSQDLVKGSMSLIDNERAHELYGLLTDKLEASGGSAANTMAGIASFGGNAAYIGKVADDDLGTVFAQDMREIGVSFDIRPTPMAETGQATGRSMILVTPDAQRTMNTYLGISSNLEVSDVSNELAASGALLFCEGYLWDADSAKAAIRHAMATAASAGRKSALTLSDGFCVDRHRDEFRELAAGPVDILFANDTELMSLYEVDFDSALERVSKDVQLACITRGPAGSVLVSGSELVEVEATDIGELTDTTGAGDQYAAGVLFGLSQGFELKRCGELGSIAAAEVISHVGPRPLQSLKALAGL